MSARDAFFKDSRDDVTGGPLHGVRILEVATTWAGPRCATIMADYGADVIKIETGKNPDVARRLVPTMPESGVGYLHSTVNRNKRCVTVDLQMPEGRDVLHLLIKTADIFVENMTPGTLASWGCGYADLREIKPDIVYVSITAYGQYGPYSHRPGYDPIAQSLTGFCHMNAASEDAPPMKAPIFLSDELGSLHGAMGAMAALRHRDVTGEGQHVDVSLVDATIASSTGLHTMAAQGLPTPRLGNSYSVGSPVNAYECKDGWVYLAVLLNGHWQSFAEAMGKPELADDERYATLPARIAHRDELDAMVSAWCKAQTRDVVTSLCESADVPSGPILTPQETVKNEHVQVRGALQSVTNSDGIEEILPAPAAKFSRTPVSIRTAAEQVGQSTDEVLGEIGLNEQQIKTLRDSGVIV